MMSIVAALLLAAVPISPVIQTIQAPEAKARIAGQVVAAETGRPVVRAGVRIVRWEGGRGVPATAVTDAQGRFEFAGLVPGSYQLSVNAAGFVGLEYGQRRPPEPGRRIQLREGEQFERADFALPRASALEGRVLDEFNDPAPGVLLQIARVDFAAGRTRLMPVSSSAAQTTDDQGHFRIFGLPPGDYYVLALSGPFANEDRAGFSPTFYPGTTTATDAQPIRLDIGKDVVNLVITLAPARLSAVSGIVRDGSGQPLASVSVMLFQLHGGDIRAVVPARTVTAPDGSFSFRNVPAGSYVLQGFGPSRSFGSLRVTAGTSALADLALTVKPGVSARGRFILEGDAPPPPVNRMRVLPRFTDFVDGPVGGGPPASRTNPDGTFEVSGLHGFGVFRADPAPPWTLKRIVLDGKDVTDTPLDFRGTDVEGLEVTLTSRQTSISGLVTDDGQPSVEYTAIVFADDRAKWTFPSRFVALARPDQGGRYRVLGLPPESYLLVALPSIQGTEWQDPTFLESVRPLATRVLLAEGESRTQDLKIVRR